MNPQATFELMLKTAAQNQAALRALAELNLNTWDKLVSKQMELYGLCFEAGSKQADLLQAVRDPQDAVTGQAQALRECGETLMAKNREMVSLLSETRDDYAKWLEGSLEQAKAQMNEAGDVATKAA
jgi:hypothetical protein